jgi:hypothetical protein
LRRHFFNEDDYAYDPLTGAPEALWPVKGSRLLQEPHSETPSTARAVVHWLNSGHNWGLRASTFKTAGDQLVEAIIRGGDGTHPDRFVFPILYLYRHATEIRLKDILLRAVQLQILGHDTVKKELGRHALGPLWEYSKLAIAELPGPSEDLELISELVSELDRADPDGQSLRYETDRSGNPNQTVMPDVIDLQNLRAVFMGLCNYLEASSGMLSDMEQQRE